MQLDNAEVTPNFNGATISYQATSLTQGSHPVSLIAADTLGNTGTKTWTFTVDTIAPTQVTGLTIAKVTSNGVDLKWTTVSDADKYNVYRDGAKVGSTTTNSYSDTGLKASTTYSYSITAVDNVGNEGIASEGKPATTSNVALIHVASIAMALKTSGFNTYATANVKIVDANNIPISGATVTGKWSSATSDSETGITNSAGTVLVQSNNVRNARTGTTFTFTVTGVTLTGYTFAPSSSDTNSIKK
jgi:fibronectin type 3 domain-containing protein